MRYRSLRIALAATLIVIALASWACGISSDSSSNSSTGAPTPTFTPTFTPTPTATPDPSFAVAPNPPGAADVAVGNNPQGLHVQLLGFTCWALLEPGPGRRADSSADTGSYWLPPPLRVQATRAARLTPSRPTWTPRPSAPESFPCPALPRRCPRRCASSPLQKRWLANPRQPAMPPCRSPIIHQPQ